MIEKDLRTGKRKILLDTRDAEEIRRCLRPFLQRFNACLIVFGSRARGEVPRASNIDLAIRADRPIPSWALAEMRECLEDSNLAMVDHRNLTVHTYNKALTEETFAALPAYRNLLRTDWNHQDEQPLPTPAH